MLYVVFGLCSFGEYVELVVLVLCVGDLDEVW